MDMPWWLGAADSGRTALSIAALTGRLGAALSGLATDSDLTTPDCGRAPISTTRPLSGRATPDCGREYGSAVGNLAYGVGIPSAKATCWLADSGRAERCRAAAGPGTP